MTDEKEEIRKRYKRFVPVEQKRSLIWLALSISTVSFFLLVAIRPTIITIVKLNKEIKEKEEAIVLLDKKIDSLIRAQKVLAEKSDKIPLLNQALPQKNEFPLILNFLSNTALESQVELSTISFEKIILSAPVTAKKSKTTIPYQTIAFSSTAKGTYFNLKNYISSLENSRRLINVVSTQISESKNKNDQSADTILQLAISGKAFFEKETQ